MNYEKLTVDRFALNLKEGKYAALTGARRAIGKTSSWSAKEKEKAHELANKHFGEAPVPKAATKATPKKAAAKKQARKAAKKAEAKVVDAPEPEIEETQSRPAPARKVLPSAQATVTTATTLPDAVSMGRQVLTFLADARAEYSAQKDLNPNGDFNRLLSDMKDATTRAVALVAINVPQSDKIDPLPAPRVALPAPAEKVAPKKMTLVTSAPVPAASASVVAPSSAPPQVGLIEPAPANGTLHLSPEEQEIARKIREAQPASTISALPRPITPAGE